MKFDIPPSAVVMYVTGCFRIVALDILRQKLSGCCYCSSRRKVWLLGKKKTRFASLFTACFNATAES